MPELDHYIRFGSHAESKNLIEVKQKIQGLTFNANVIAHTPAAIYKMLFINFPNTSFFIDPQTYIFQLDPIKYYSTLKLKKRQLKNSVKQVISQYGEPLYKVESLNSLNYNDFINSDLSKFIDSVLNFQLNYLYEEYSKNKTDEGYDDYDDSDNNHISPTFIIPPYFFLSPDDNIDEWLELNMKCAEYAIKMYSKNNVVIPELVIDKSILLLESERKKIIEAYNSLESDKILLWIDNFNEVEESFNSLKGFVSFVRSLNKNVINLYGGGLSLLLTKKRIISGFCHGPGYGENRAVKPVGGGIPTAKYYLPFAMNRVSFEAANRILTIKNNLNSTYFDEVCNCNTCIEKLKPPISESFYDTFGKYELSSSGKINIPTQESLQNSNKHYLYRRFIEITDLSLQNLLDYINSFVVWNSESKLASTKYLTFWQDIIN